MDTGAVLEPGTTCICCKPSRVQAAPGNAPAKRGTGVRKGSSSKLVQCTQAIASCTSTQWPQAIFKVNDFVARGYETDVVLHNSLLTICARGEQWRRPSLCLRKFRCDLLQPTAISYNSAIHAFALSAEWKDASSLLQDASCRRLEDVSMCNSLISALAKCTRWARALHALSALTHGPLKCTPTSISAAISACQRDLWHSALRLLATALELHVQADGVMYNSCISMCEKGAQWQHALVLLLRRAWAHATSSHAYNAAISACEKGSRWQQALAIFQGMTGSVRVDVITYNALISACSQRWQLALHLMEELLRSKQKPTLVTFNAALSALGTAEQWLEALRMLTQLQIFDLLPDLFTFHALIACSKAHWRSACALLAEVDMRFLQRDLMTYSAASSAYCSSDRWELSLHLGSQVGSGDAHICADTIIACDRGGRWESALSWLSYFKSSAVEVDLVAHNVALGACASQGAWPRALLALRRLAVEDQAALMTYDIAIIACTRAEKGELRR